MPRTFAIGDIHGHVEKLEGILEQIWPVAAPGDALVFLGDYIDRGPDSKGVIQTVRSLERDWKGPVTCLMGNHEDMLLDHLREEVGGARLYGEGIWEENGGYEGMESFLGRVQHQRLLSVAPDLQRSYDPEIQSYLGTKLIGISKLLPPDLLEWFAALKLDHEDEHGYYVHAGFRPGKRPEQCSRMEKLWIRDQWVFDTKHRLGKPVVFGHTPISKQLLRGKDTRTGKKDWCPMVGERKLGIDTGCAFGGPLCCVRLPEREFFFA